MEKKNFTKMNLVGTQLRTLEALDWEVIQSDDDYVRSRRSCSDDQYNIE